MSALFDLEAYDAKGRVDFCLHPANFTVVDITREAELYRNKRAVVTVFTSHTPNESPEITKVAACGIYGKRLKVASFYKHKPIADMELTEAELDDISKSFHGILAPGKKEKFAEIFGSARERLQDYLNARPKRKLNVGWLTAAMTDSCLEALGYGSMAVLPTDISQTRHGARRLIAEYLENEEKIVGFYDNPKDAPVTAFTRNDKMKIVLTEGGHKILGRGGDPVDRVPLAELEEGLANADYHAASYLHTVLDHTGAENMMVYNDNPSYVWIKFRTLRKFFNKSKLPLTLPLLSAIEKTTKQTLLERALEL